MSSSRGGAVVFLVRLAMFLLVFTALAEVWLRTITPAREVPHPYQADPATIVRFDPSFRPDGETTVGRLARPGGRWRINNGGWNSAVDCVSAAARDRPLVALFGDSFIEGFATNVDQHVDAYLLRILRPGTDVYAFGESA